MDSAPWKSLSRQGCMYNPIHPPSQQYCTCTFPDALMLGRKLGTHTCAENVDNTPAMILMDTILTSQNVNTWFVIAYQKLNKREQTYQKNIFMKTLQLKHPQMNWLQALT